MYNFFYKNKREFSLLFFIYIIYLVFLPPNLTSGDSGELITASYLLGIGHASGYPLYLVLLKAIYFIPIGNIAFRCALLTAFFSLISLFLCMKIVHLITRNYTASFLSVFLLCSSYSFFNQSLIIKFYTLNLAIILMISFLSLKILIEEHYDFKLQYCIAFLLGLSTANHHTALLLFIPLFFVAILNFNCFIKKIFQSLLLFFCGFSVNLYILIIFFKKRYFKLETVTNLTSLFKVYFLRSRYGKSSSVNLVTDSLIKNFTDNWLGTINKLSFIFKANYPYILFFSILSIFFFIYFKKNKQTFGFLLLAFLSFSLLLGRITLPQGNMSSMNYYIIANQYFLPGFAFFAIIASTSFALFVNLCQKKNLKLLKQAGFLVFILPLSVFPQRFFDSLHSTNYAVYQSGKDRVAELPLNSVYLTFGDFYSFNEFYIKNVLHFRSDIFDCSMATIESKTILISKAKLLNKYYFYEKFPIKTAINFFKNEKIFISSIGNFNYSQFKDYFILRRYNLNFLLVPGFYDNVQPEFHYPYQKNYDNNILKSLINPYPCIEHYVDDLMTVASCRSYYLHPTSISAILKSKIHQWNNIVDYYDFVKQEQNE